MSNIGPEVRVTVTATMTVSLHPYNAYADYIGLPGFPDIPDEEVRKIPVDELAVRMVKIDNEHGNESLGALYNEDWNVSEYTPEVVED